MKETRKAVASVPKLSQRDFEFYEAIYKEDWEKAHEYLAEGKDDITKRM